MDTRRPLREVDFWVSEMFGIFPVVVWKVLEGSGGVHHGAHDLGGLAWAEGMLPGLMGRGTCPKAQASQPPRVSRGDQLGEGKALSPPLAAAPNPRWEGGHPGRLAPYIKREGWPATTPHHCLLLRLSLHHTLLGLGEALQFSSSTTTTTPSCCWNLEEINHTSAAAGTGEEGASSTPYARSIPLAESLVLRRITFRDHQPSTCFLAPTGSIKPWFHTKTCFYTHHTFHLGFPTDVCIYAYHAPSINFNQFLEKEKLKGNGSNFTDWFRHVRIFLTGGSLQYVLDAPLGPPPPPAVSEDIKNVYETRVTRYSEVQCAILCSLEAELQKRFEHHDPCDMMRELKLIFETHAAVESYEASKQFFGMMEEGSSVSEHIDKEGESSVDGQQDHQFQKQGKPNKGEGAPGRNCSKYLADLKSGHVKKKGISDIHVIDVYLTGVITRFWPNQEMGRK
ncbi:hypothetical protein QYE76_000751 [Lolium multiflorum]|uniref:Uncharacterized protein n=1 Tax=Lolium multiflorum TaxID=4521 RepID=A0AAD8RI65_LOLMU|nr:hypothetical protein QYE76_000751 [Lolium multiflorum]